MGGDCNSLIDGNALGLAESFDLSDFYCNSLIDGNALGHEAVDDYNEYNCNSLIDGNALGPVVRAHSAHA